MEKDYYAYILRCADNTLYCGYTVDLAHRLKVHNEGNGAKYTRARRPVTLAYKETFSSKSEAMKREAALKTLTHAEKERLIQAASQKSTD